MEEKQYELAQEIFRDITIPKNAIEETLFETLAMSLESIEMDTDDVEEVAEKLFSAIEWSLDNDISLITSLEREDFAGQPALEEIAILTLTDFLDFSGEFGEILYATIEAADSSLTEDEIDEVYHEVQNLGEKLLNHLV
jgi:hypothetical protein